MIMMKYLYVHRILQVTTSIVLLVEQFKKSVVMVLYLVCQFLKKSKVELQCWVDYHGSSLDLLSLSGKKINSIITFVLLNHSEL